MAADGQADEANPEGDDARQSGPPRPAPASEHQANVEPISLEPKDDDKDDDKKDDVETVEISDDPFAKPDEEP